MNSIPNPSTTRADKLLNNLYIGDIIVANDKLELKGLGITHILICGSYIEPIYPNVELI